MSICNPMGYDRPHGFGFKLLLIYIFIASALAALETRRLGITYIFYISSSSGGQGLLLNWLYDKTRAMQYHILGICYAHAFIWALHVPCLNMARIP